MRKAELQNRIERLHGMMSAYRALLVESRDPTVPRIVRNGQRLEQMRSDLNRSYGSVSDRLSRLGGDGRQFQIALSATELPRRGPHIDVALQTLEQALGRLGHMSENEYASIFVPRQPEAHDSSTISAGVLQHVRNSHRVYWGVFLKSIRTWIRNHISEVVTGLIIVALAALLGF